MTRLETLTRYCDTLLGFAQGRELLGAAKTASESGVTSSEHYSRGFVLQFSESNTPWQAVPRWVDFLLRCGYFYADPVPSGRRIGLISMPSESAAAGLVALGAMRRRLGINDANDSTLHYQRIERLAANHNIYTFLRHNNETGRFRLEGKDGKGVIWVRKETGGDSRFSNRTRLATRIAIFPWRACDWHFDGEAPVQTAKGTELRHVHFYEALMNRDPIVRSSLSFSDSGICLAGRIAGESVSRAIFGQIRFRQDNHFADLSELLAIQGWLPGTISRVTFFNTRTRQFDRNTGLTRLVVADGDSAFLRVLESTEFKSSDVLGVISRTVERERLESIGFKIAELQQWYAPDFDRQGAIPRLPSGITLLELKRR